MRIYVAGIGPGSTEDITPAVINALKDSDVVVGYKYYFQFVAPYLRPETKCIDTGMKRERDRAAQAFDLAQQGKTVCVISSGDAGIYGMAPLIYEMQKERGTDFDIVPLPGISAFQKAASLLGAPMGHDFCVISLSDLMTPWQQIERRIKAAAEGDFITAIYNPRSHGRYWQLHRLKEIFMQVRDENTVVGYVRQAGREEETVNITSLRSFNPDDIDMFTVVIIGNSQSFTWRGKFITPRGYYRQQTDENTGVGQSIMIESFRTIRSSLLHPDAPLWRLWPTLHAIHTTADFEMERLLWMDDNATEILHKKFTEHTIHTIVTDVSMVASGIRKGAIERLGIKVVSYINDPRGKEMAHQLGITRSQAGIRLALEDYPSGKGVLFAFGNAPTALIELCTLINRGVCFPEGIIGAPVGFVHVEESKHAAKPFHNIPKILIEGRKGGSNIAATLVNSILTYDDAEQLRPGRDV